MLLKILLIKIFISEMRYNLILAKLNNNTGDETSTKSRTCTANITLSNFVLEVNSDTYAKSRNSNFFVLVLSHSTDLFITEAVTSSGNKLVFNESFYFKNVETDFSIQAEIFCITLKTDTNLLETFFRKVRCYSIVLFIHEQ